MKNQAVDEIKMTIPSRANLLSYPETIEYLYHRLPMFERIGPAAFKKDLTNIRELCKVLDNPQDKFKSIHVAGTNGKGSVSHMLCSILMEAGYKTGLYISPHYKDYRERIRVNGHFISKKFIIDFVERIQGTMDQIKPSFFEITVAMAFEYFAARGVQIAVIETGLGGRLDSTNVIHPVLSIITNIGYDHQNMLGNTLNKIAGEKAGIIKKQVPVIIGEYQREVYGIFKRKAAELNCPILIASKQGKVMTQETTHRYVYRSKDKSYLKLAMPYHGPYQEKNINTVIQAINQLNTSRVFLISQKSIQQGLKKIDHHVPLIGRYQQIGVRPEIIVDGAHNKDGLLLFFRKIREISKGQIHCVFGMVKDKDIDMALSILPKRITYYFVKARLPRALDDVTLLEKATAIGLNGTACGTVKNGYRLAMKSALVNDLVVVTGSIFVVGEIL